MKKKKLRKIIKALRLENARLAELNRQGLSEDLERGFNDLLNTGVSVSGPFVTDIKSERPIDLYLNAEMLTPENHEKYLKEKEGTKECDKFCGMNYCDENGCINRKRVLTDPIEPKEQSSTEIWKEYFGKPQKGVFDHPKYRSPFFTFGPFGNIEENNVEGNPV